MKNYIELISKYHPSVDANCEGDTSVYSNITFITGTVTKEVLDEDYITFLKSEKRKEIEQNTFRIISEGFVFDGKSFSLDAGSQFKWDNLHDHKQSFAWPISISTLNYEEYSLAEADIVSFWGTGMTIVKNLMDSCRNLKLQVNQATTEAQINAIIDNR